MPDGCPFQPFSSEFRDDPYPVFADVRSAGPTFHSDELDMWVITRHADVAMALSDTQRFSASNMLDPLFEFDERSSSVIADGFGAVPVMPNLDPPEHGRIRRHNLTAFSRRRVAALEATIRQMATDMLDDALSAGRFDWAQGVAFPLPINVIFHLVGFPDEDGEMVKGWASDRLTSMFGRPTEDRWVLHRPRRGGPSRAGNGALPRDRLRRPASLKIRPEFGGVHRGDIGPARKPIAEERSIES